MIQQDYLLRMIEEMGIFVRRILGQELSGETIATQVNALSEQWIGLPASMLLDLPPEEACRFVEESERLVVEKIYLLAELSRVQGMTAEDPQEQRLRWANAVFFYARTIPLLDGKLKTTVEQRIQEVESVMANLST